MLNFNSRIDGSVTLFILRCSSNPCPSVAPSASCCFTLHILECSRWFKFRGLEGDKMSPLLADPSLEWTLSKTSVLPWRVPKKIGNSKLCEFNGRLSTEEDAPWRTIFKVQRQVRPAQIYPNAFIKHYFRTV